jgi:hypothetical protein
MLAVGESSRAGSSVVEQGSFKPLVAGSNPARLTKMLTVVSSVQGARCDRVRERRGSAPAIGALVARRILSPKFRAQPGGGTLTLGIDDGRSKEEDEVQRPCTCC